jgi:phage terminase large subunit-like protein
VTTLSPPKTSESVASATSEPGLAGLVSFCDLIGEPLEPYQRRIARLYFGPEREMAAILPRGNAKTTTAALIGLHHLLTVPGAAVTIGAASRDQARIAYERMRGFAGHEALEANLVVRHLELRHEDEEGHLRLLRVIASDGPRAHGLSSSLYIADELWAWKDAELIEAMQTGLVKRPDAKLLMISTAAALLDSPLGRLRARAMAQPSAKRTGPVVTASGELAWIEWSVPEEADLDDMRAVKRANPAPWIAKADLRRQRSAVAELAFAQYHAGRWGAREGAWLPAGAWQACAGEAAIEDGEHVWVGVDVGGSRAASAVVMVTADLRVRAQTWQGDDAVLKVAAHVRELAGRYQVREVAYDPWRFRSEALRLEEAGLPVVEFPQSTTRMVPASERLYAAVVERRLTHGNDPDLNAHVAGAIAKQTNRGWRLDKSERGAQIDAVVALAMALERAEAPDRPARLLGWL